MRKFGKSLEVGDIIVSPSDANFKITKIEQGDTSPFGQAVPNSFWHRNPLTIWSGKDYAVIAPSDSFETLDK